MKLSKAQQEVVDKMREGWVLSYYIVSHAALKKVGEKPIVVNKNTIRSLLTRGLIELAGLSTICRLTEQYKKEQK